MIEGLQEQVEQLKTSQADEKIKFEDQIVELQSIVQSKDEELLTAQDQTRISQEELSNTRETIRLLEDELQENATIIANEREKFVRLWKKD